MSAREDQSIQIRDMLAQIGSGLGAAAASVAKDSQTSIGALAVQSAEVKLDFLLNVRKQGNTASGSSLGELILRGPRISTSYSSLEESNKASIVLKIVTIPPPSRLVWPWSAWTAAILAEATRRIDTLLHLRLTSKKAKKAVASGATKASSNASLAKTTSLAAIGERPTTTMGAASLGGGIPSPGHLAVGSEAVVHESESSTSVAVTISQQEEMVRWSVHAVLKAMLTALASLDKPASVGDPVETLVDDIVQSTKVLEDPKSSVRRLLEDADLRARLIRVRSALDGMALLAKA